MIAAEITKKKALLKQRLERIERIKPALGRMRESEHDFVLSIIAKLDRYGIESRLSPAQLDWLEALEKRYAPDERQASLFGGEE